MQKKQQFAFSAINFYLLAVSIVTVLIGFVLMSGKGSPNTHFDPAIFNTTRTVVAPPTPSSRAPACRRAVAEQTEPP